MECTSLKIDKENLQDNLPKKIDSNLPAIKTDDISEDGAISIYSMKKSKITQKEAEYEFDRLRFAFPSLKPEFFVILGERLSDVNSNFNYEKLHDAVSHVIDTFTYLAPMVGNIMSYDKKMKFYTYEQLCQMAVSSGDVFAKKEVWDKYKRVKTDDYDTVLFAHIKDINRYKLEIYKHGSKQNI